MAPTATGRGYWLVASDGGIFSFGDARFHGSAGAMALPGPVVAIGRSAGGYRLAGTTGKVIPFGGATFHGPVGPMPLARPVVGMSEAG
jgi:hypothetical protein